METAIRWSTHSTTTDQHFLHVDVIGRKVHLRRLNPSNLSNLTYENVSTRSRVPAFRAFDWSPSNPALVALGQSSGEATVLRIDGDSEASLSFSIRSQRLCNAVALNTQGLLAAGLDKVRNDFCLNIWDLNQRVPNIAGPGTHGFGNDKGSIDPYAKLASSEPITSIKFFAGQPNTLIAGVKSQYVRLYDLREAHGYSALQFPTRCVHNLAIDPLDENFIASCVPTNDPTVCIWDKRAGNKTQSAPLSFTSDTGHFGPSLELKSVADVHGSIWSLRFAKTRRGCLGMLTSTGQLKTFDVGKEQISGEERRDRDTSWGKDWSNHHPEDLFIERMQEIERPFHSKKATKKEQKRVVSFDFITLDNNLRAPGMITQAADGQIRITGVGPGKRASSFSPFPPKPRLQKQFHGDDRGERGSPPAKTVQEKSDAAPKQEKRLRTRFSSNPMRIFRERCEKGYRFDAIRNRSIVGSEKALSRFWKDVEHARSLCDAGSLVDDHLDLSHLGVTGIWMDELGDAQSYSSRRKSATSRSNSAPARTTEALARSLELPKLIPSPQTSFAAHRQLCLYVTGLQKTLTELESEVKRLTRHGYLTKAAALALFASEPKLAIRALRQKTSGEVNKMLAMAIASSRSRQMSTQQNEDGSMTSSDDSESEWNDTLSSLISSLPPAKEDPYAHAIIHTIIHGTPAHSSVLSNKDLPLPLVHRLYIALHHLPDRELTSYISTLTKLHVANGRLEGVLLTGLGTPDAISLFRRYIARSGDIQTGVLALTTVIPRYLSDRFTVRLFECWRQEYRTQMQSWDLKFERVKFDIAGRKLAVSRTGEPLIRAPKPQISITCAYCQEDITQIPAPARPGFPSHDSGSVTEDGVIITGADNLTSSSTKPSNAPQPPGPVPTKFSTIRTPHSHPLAPTRPAAIGTICPKCGRGLPRCGICELPLGYPDPTYVKPLNTGNPNRSGRDTKAQGTESNTNGNSANRSRTDSPIPPSSQRGNSVASTIVPGGHGGHKATTSDLTSSSTPRNLSTTNHSNGPTTNDPNNPTNDPQIKASTTTSSLITNTDEILSKFITFCISCGHGFHASHAREWFRPNASDVDVGHGNRSGEKEREMEREREKEKGTREVCPVAGCGCLCWRKLA